MGTFPNIRTKSKLPTHLVDEMESLLTIALAEYLVRDIGTIDQVINEIGRLLTSVDLSKYEKIVRDDMNTLLDYAVGEIDYEESLRRSRLLKERYSAIDDDANNGPLHNRDKGACIGGHFS